MPRFGTENISVRHGTGNSYLGDGNEPIWCNEKYVVMVNVHGLFYADIPERLHEAALTQRDEDDKPIAKRSNRSSKVQVFDATLKGLRMKLHKIHEAYLNPEVKVTEVIAYNFKTDVSFAIDANGDIQPNCYYGEGTKWPESDMYGRHPGGRGHWGGYALTIGARALKKTTRKYGNGSVRVSYEPFYGYDENGKDLSHFNRDHPASRLNAWCHVNLPDRDFKTIPYTDEAAEFFFNLMYGMSEIARRIQDRVSDKDDLLELINSRQKLLAAPENKS